MTYNNRTGLPSVTQILKPFIMTDYFTEEHSERGSCVHTACNAHLNGAYVPPLDPEHQPYFDSFRRWVDVVNPKLIMSEKRLSDSKKCFCGQFDFSYSDGAIILADIKTSQQKHLWHRLQGAAYRYLYDNFSGEDRTNRGGNVRLFNDGRRAIFDEWPTNYMSDFNVFVGILNAHNFFNK